jgi:pilus assembly protein CpaE
VARILVVDDTPMMVQLATLALAKAGHEVRGAGDGVQGVAVAKEWRPELIIMDVMMPELDGYEATRQIRAYPPLALTPIVVITDQDTLAEKLSAFQAGADDHLTKPFEPLELLARVEVHLKRARAAAGVIEALATEPAKAAGYTIACFSLRGGSGVSTLASSLAVALAQIWSRPCLLLDLVLAGGHAALLLNVPSKVTWADLARVETANYDPVFVEQHLVIHASGVRVLSAPIRVQDGDLVAAEHVTGVLNFVQTSYDYIVADLPHDFRDTTLAVLDRATTILMPFAPELASVRSVAAALEAFEALDYPAERLRLILNRTFPKDDLPQAGIEKALKHKIDLVLPYDKDYLVKAINRGEPVTSGAADNPLGSALEDYAFAITRDVVTSSAPDRPSEAWRRVTQRVGQTLSPKKG